MFPKHCQRIVLCQMGNGPPGLFSLELITPTYPKNKPTFASALLVLGLPLAPHGTHWNRQEKVNFHMPHLGPFNIFSKKSFKVGSEKRFVV